MAAFDLINPTHMIAANYRHQIRQTINAYSIPYLVVGEALQNAMDAVADRDHDGNGAITISMDFDNQTVLVEDNGMGFPADPSLLLLGGTNKKGGKTSAGLVGVGIKVTLFSSKAFSIKTTMKERSWTVRIAEAHLFDSAGTSSILIDDCFEEDRDPLPHTGTRVVVQFPVGEDGSSKLNEFLDRLAEFLDVLPDEIVFTSGATEANNLAILGSAQAARDTKRKRILVSAIEHKCVIAAAYAAQDLFGFSVETIPVCRTGRVDLDWLGASLGDDVLLVSVMAVNNEVGTIQDIATISEMTRAVGAFFHSDCAQAPMAIDMCTLTTFLDLASLSAHKMYGPKGIGVLFIGRSAQSRVQPIIHGGGQQRNMRSGTIPVPLVVGMAAATTLLVGSSGNDERKRIASLRERLVDGIGSLGIPTILNTPLFDAAHPGNANVGFPGRNAQDILQRLQPQLAASTGSACSSGIPEPSHVLRAIGLTKPEAESCIRFSVGRFTTEQDIEQAIGLLAEAVG